MPTTPNRSLRYPASNNSPNVPQDIQNLATDTDNALALIFGKAWRTSGASAVLAPTATELLVQFDNARTAGGVTYDNTNKQLVLPVDGLYDIDACVYLTSASSASGHVGGWIRRTRSGVADLATAQGQIIYKDSTALDQRGFWSHKAVPFKAGDRLALILYAYDPNLNNYGQSEYQGTFLNVRYVAPLAGATPV